jgi:hypothetical protein
VPRGARPRAVLAPPGHPTVDERGVAFPARLRADAQTLGHAGTEAFDEHVGTFDQTQRRRQPERMTQVEDDVAPGAFQQVVLGGRRFEGTDGRRSTRSTSAPISANSMAANGAGPIPASSSTRSPANGPDRASLGRVTQPKMAQPRQVRSRGRAIT